MKTSCITHPANEPLIIIRQWQVEFCNGNHCAAALLSFFEYWHNIKLEMAEKNRQANAVAEKHGDTGTQDTSLYQFHTATELEEGLVTLFRAESIRKARRNLVKLKVLTEHRNPNPRYAFDATIHYLFHPEVCDTWLSTYPSRENQRRANEIVRRSLENKRRSLENKQAIPETSSETSSETSILEDKTKISQNSENQEPEDDQTLWPKWYANGYAVPGWKVPLKQAEAWRVEAGIPEGLAEVKSYALRDWWARLPEDSARRKKGDPYLTLQNWCREARDGWIKNNGGNDGKPGADTQEDWAEQERLKFVALSIELRAKQKRAAEDRAAFAAGLPQVPG